MVLCCSVSWLRKHDNKIKKTTREKLPGAAEQNWSGSGGSATADTCYSTLCAAPSCTPVQGKLSNFMLARCATNQ